MNDGQERIAVQIVGRRNYAEGGLASAARNVANAGVGGDTMIVHINRDEFNKLRQTFGEPTVNPNTHMPQFASNWLAPVASIVGSLLGGGSAVGDAIGNATGLYEAGSTTSNAIGSGLLGAGIGGLTGGGQGALLGGLTGAATPYLSNALGINSGGGVLGGLLGGGGGGSGSGGGGGYSDTNQVGTAGTDSSENKGGGLFQKGGALPYIIGGLMVADAIGKASQKPSAASQAAAAQNAAAQERFNAPLPQVSFQRSRVPSGQIDYANYGKRGGQSFFQGNALPTVNAARGGHIARGALMQAANNHPQGKAIGSGDGRDDMIPANLSNNEYVVDAETTALLGNGSPEAGARKLDAMRANLRKHKGGALARGKFSPPAKSPESYMMGGRA